MIEQIFGFNKKRFSGLKLVIEFSKEIQVDILYAATALHNFIVYYCSKDKEDLLDFQQRIYTHQILSLPNSILTKNILAITYQTGDGNAQLDDLPECDSTWSTTRRIKTYGQYLVWQVLVGFSIDPEEELKPISAMLLYVFLGKVFIEKKSRAIQIAKEDLTNLTL